MPDSPSPLVAVIGIGRTLSSALCESMMLMGVDFGRQQIRGEHVWLATYLESLHPFPTVAKQCFDHPFPWLAKQAHYGRDIQSDLADILRRIVAQCETRLPAVKDPCLCWHLPELATAWSAVYGVGPIHWIHIDRQLEDSVRSLIDRSTPRRSSPRFQANADECRRFQQSLWLAKEAWFRAEDSPPHLHVWAEDLLDDPARELMRVADHIGLAVPPEKLERAAGHIDRGKAPHSRAKV